MLKKIFDILFINSSIQIIDEKENIYNYGKKPFDHKLVIYDKKFYRKLLKPNAFTLGEAYVAKYFDIKSDLVDFLEMMQKIKIPISKLIKIYFFIIIINLRNLS